MGRRAVAILIGILALAGLAAWQVQPVLPAAGASATPTPTKTEGPDRKTTIQVPYTSYEWWVNSWQNNQVLCQLWIEHEGLPTAIDIVNYCDPIVYTLWVNTKPCTAAGTGGDIRTCNGVYMHLVGSQETTRDVSVDLPAPTVWVSVSGCNPLPPDNRCTALPGLLLTGEEPLPNESIISIHGMFNGEPFTCPGGACVLPIPPTGTQGIPVEFWADSSFGDSTLHYTAQVRAVPEGDFMSPDNKGTAGTQLWYVDVLSTQWRGAPLASCADTWEAFPDIGGPPQWLTTPQRVEELASSQPLYFLAGLLIENGEVNAGDCPNDGLSSPGVANTCGLQKAMPRIQSWQNQFDAEIIQVANDTGVPGQLMKNIFARESQFWPGIYRTYKEAGLGQLTENGAETTLLWNPDFFNQFCPLVFQRDICNKGWTRLTLEHQTTLKGALVNKVNAACPNCPSGIDLSRARFSVGVFANTLRANCEQAGQIVHNVTNKSAGASTSYVDLWLFTLVNYNAGPGCLSYAVKQAYAKGQPLDWPHVGNQLVGGCTGSIRYIESITSAQSPSAALTATALAPTPVTPVVIGTQLTRTATPATRTATPTITRTGTPATATPTGEVPYPVETIPYPASTEQFPY